MITQQQQSGETVELAVIDDESPAPMIISRLEY
jgi:hypothetical protein